MAADRAAALLLLDYQSKVGVQTTFEVYENGPLRQEEVFGLVY